MPLLAHHVWTIDTAAASARLRAASGAVGAQVRDHRLDPGVEQRGDEVVLESDGQVVATAGGARASAPDRVFSDDTLADY